MDSPRPNEFERSAAGGRDLSIFSEFAQFLRHTRKWWLTPIIAVLLLFGVLIFLSGTGAAPFIYTLF